MKRSALLTVLMLALVSLFCCAIKGSAEHAHAGASVIWIPLLEPLQDDTIWHSTGNNIWSVSYPKQYDQTQFKVCGFFRGKGDVFISYGGEGDPYSINFEQDTARCYSTYVGYGGGTVPIHMGLYLTGSVSVREPQIFVGQER